MQENDGHIFRITHLGNFYPLNLLGLEADDLEDPSDTEHQGNETGIHISGNETRRDTEGTEDVRAVIILRREGGEIPCS
jgi:hypothetical protein